jgi:hypothetical protein
MTQQQPRKQKRTTNNKVGEQYFTKVHEDAILQYCVSTDQKERERLYVEYIQPSFDLMVDKIVYTYKFNNLPNIGILAKYNMGTWN